MTEPTGFPIDIVQRGDVGGDISDYATKRITPVLEQIGGPILFARARITRDGDARTRPVVAQASISINGELLRGQVAADTASEAVDLLADRLRDQVQHRAERRRADRALARRRQAGEWRHGDRRQDLYVDLPADEREIIPAKSFAVVPATPDEAAADMEQLDHDFWLFHDLASDADAVIDRDPGGGYRLQRAEPVDAEAGPVAIDLHVIDTPPPTATLDEAVLQLVDSRQPFLFFIDPATARGKVVYRRYDGHFGVLTAE